MVSKPLSTLITLSMKDSVSKTFSKCLSMDKARLVGTSGSNVKFHYEIPLGLCFDENRPQFSTSATLAVFDELSTYGFMINDKSHRTGVSVHLSTERLQPVGPNEKVTISIQTDKIGKTLGFCSMQMMNSSGVVVARGKHIKYLPMGLGWDLFTHPWLFPRLMDFHERYGERVGNTYLGKKIQLAILGGRNRGNMETVGDGALGSIFSGLGMIKEPETSKRQYCLLVKPFLNNMIGRMHGGAVAMAIEQALMLDKVDSGKDYGGTLRQMEIRYLSALSGHLSISVDDTTLTSPRTRTGQVLARNGTCAEYSAEWA